MFSKKKCLQWRFRSVLLCFFTEKKKKITFHTMCCVKLTKYCAENCIGERKCSIKILIHRSISVLQQQRGSLIRLGNTKKAFYQIFRNYNSKGIGRVKRLSISCTLLYTLFFSLPPPTPRSYLIYLFPFLFPIFSDFAAIGQCQCHLHASWLVPIMYLQLNKCMFPLYYIELYVQCITLS